MYYQSISMCSNVPFSAAMLCIVSVHFCKCTCNLYTVLPACRPYECAHLHVHMHMH